MGDPRPPRDHGSTAPLALDLFCGAGGASIGLEEAGYDVVGFDKWADAVDTHNLNGRPAHELDLSTCTSTYWGHVYGGAVDLLWGSPPCQPFSQGGKQQGRHDPRDGFPWFLAAVQGVRPRVFVMENVRGLTFKKNADYLASIVTELEQLGYAVEWEVLNCADYGVPQKRQRLFMVGRRDGVSPALPFPTHCREGDILPRWISMAEALGWADDDLELPTVELRAGATVWPQLAGTISLNRRQNNAMPVDVLTEPAPTVTGESGGQWVVADTRTAPEWATSSPAPTVSGTFGGVGGKVKGGHHNLTVEEARVLQDFPEGYQFVGTKTSQFLQIGNAVPSRMARLLAEANR